MSIKPIKIVSEPCVLLELPTRHILPRPMHTTMAEPSCCHDRKIMPLPAAVAGYDAWIAAIRKDQTRDRALAAVVQWDPKFNLVKVNPLLHWTKKDVWNFVVKNDVPYNPLHDHGYPSIG